jgi:hypothetical protein
MMLLEPGQVVEKTGRTTGYTIGVVNGIGVQVWSDGAKTEEIAIIKQLDTPGSEAFADSGDSGSQVVAASDGNYWGVGQVTGKNEQHRPVWVAATPLWAVAEDVESSLNCGISWWAGT